MKVLHIFTLFTTANAFFNGQFRYLSERGYQLEMASQCADVEEFCSLNNVIFHPLNISRSISIIADLKTIVEAVRLIRKNKYDIVFGHTPKGAMIAMIAAKLAGVKTRVYYRHGLIYTTATGFKRIILKKVEQLTALFSSRIVNVSPSLSNLAVREHLNGANKQTIIGYGTCGGIDAVNLFNPELVSESDKQVLYKDLLINQDNFIIGFCGRICKDKGIRELIDGFVIFRENHPEVKSKLLLIGGYDQRDILPENYKCIIEDDSDIIFVDKVHQYILPKYYSLMDIFVFPSYREGFGMCVVEAAAMEVPALVSRSHGCIDSIEEHVTGEYIDISPENIAKKIYLLTDETLRIRLGKNARHEVLKKYEHSVMWPQILDFYTTLKDEKLLDKK